MKTDLTVFNASELEILARLGFDDDGEITVRLFLKSKILKQRPRYFHGKGVALRSVCAMLKKISPDDRIFKKEEEVKLFDDEDIEQLLDGLSF